MPLPQPASARLSPSSFAYGCLLGEGSYGRVIHARLLLPSGKLAPGDYAVKMIEKRVIQREKKVRPARGAAQPIPRAGACRRGPPPGSAHAPRPRSLSLSLGSRTAS